MKAAFEAPPIFSAKNGIDFGYNNVSLTTDIISFEQQCPERRMLWSSCEPPEPQHMH